MGTVSPERRMHGSFGDYQVHPGLYNEAWSPPATPEPATAIMLMVLLSAWTGGDRRAGRAAGKRTGGGL